MSDDEYPYPETAAETRAVADLIWGDHPELATIGDVRKAMTEKLNAMRQEQADLVEIQNANGMRYEASRGAEATHVVFGEAEDTREGLQTQIENLDRILAARGIDEARQDEIMARYAANPMGVLADAVMNELYPPKGDR